MLVCVCVVPAVFVCAYVVACNHVLMLLCAPRCYVRVLVCCVNVCGVVPVFVYWFCFCACS